MCNVPQLIQRGNVGTTKQKACTLRIVQTIVGGVGTIRLTVGRDAISYSIHVFGVPAQVGRKAVEWKTVEQRKERTHHALVENNGRVSCDCMGHLRWGHCKHADAVKKLAELGKL